jgi:hypothetical protein
MNRQTTGKAWVWVLLCSVIVASSASAMFLRPPNVPTERLIQNITAYLQANPKDAQAHFLLARVHYIAFAHRSPTIQANDEGSEQRLPKITDPRLQGHDRNAPKINEAKAIEHARAAILRFRMAIELNGDKALYHLGLAGIFEQAAPLADKVEAPMEIAPGHGRKPEADKPKADKPDLTVKYAQAAIKHNLIAYRMDRKAALAADHVFHPFFPTAYEAGKAVQRLVKEYKLELDDEKVLPQIASDIIAIDAKPMAITPIVFRIEGRAPRLLDELLAKSHTVRFDLDGDGVAELRPWVKPDTAILVWDPEQTGRITSGRQLFGNMTFFMLFSDGYRALDALDDDRDGQLAGEELTGLAVWHDRNTNGISEPGEVTPIDRTPIHAIRTQSRSLYHGIHPMNPAGLTLDNGATRPTWDWIIPAAN